MGYVMDSEFFPLTFCVILHLSLLLSLSRSPTRNPLVGGMEPFLASSPHTTLARSTADPPLRRSLSLSLSLTNLSLLPLWVLFFRLWKVIYAWTLCESQSVMAMMLSLLTLSTENPRQRSSSPCHHLSQSLYLRMCVCVVHVPMCVYFQKKKK